MGFLRFLNSKNMLSYKTTLLTSCDLFNIYIVIDFDKQDPGYTNYCIVKDFDKIYSLDRPTANGGYLVN
jgi:hypothetical protein